jgi:hypothetical protein
MEVILMSEDKSGKAKITIEVELNEALMTAAKEWRPKMGWMGPWGGMGSWRSHGMMGGQMPWGMPWSSGPGMQCPACGEPMVKPGKEQVLEMLERRKERLVAVLEHINMEIDKLKETKEEAKKE